MKPTQLFPCALILLDLLTAGVYGTHLDWRKTIYWLAAATLTAAVTF